MKAMIEIRENRLSGSIGSRSIAEIREGIPELAPVRFSLFRLHARRVSVVGAFNGWNPLVTPLAPAGHDWWLRELWLPPGLHEYLFVVDGRWICDPAAVKRASNPFGGMNAVVEVNAPQKLKAIDLRSIPHAQAGMMKRAAIRPGHFSNDASDVRAISHHLKARSSRDQPAAGVVKSIT